MKRFYEKAAVAPLDSGYTVKLDQRPLKTPLKSALVTPTEALAALVAEEWNGQEEVIKPEAMHMTKLVNTAIDRVEARRAEIVAELIDYAGTDLICYYADYPEMLVSKQKELWQPYQNWMQEQFNIKLNTTSGIMHVAQDDSVAKQAASIISDIDSFRLTPLHAFTTGLGSFTLGLNVVLGDGTLDKIWPVAQVDELFQEEEWGVDEENTTRRKNLYYDLQTAERFLLAL